MDVSLSPFRLEPISATFHGRDVFAPVAAQLASGASLAEAGEEIDPASLVELPRPEPAIEEGRVVADVVSVDGYGNVDPRSGRAPAAGAGLRLGRPLSVEAPATLERAALFALTFADAPTAG